MSGGEDLATQFLSDGIRLILGSTNASTKLVHSENCAGSITPRQCLGQVFHKYYINVLSFNGTSAAAIPVMFSALLFVLVLVLLVGLPFCMAPEKCCKALIKHHRVSHTIAVISSWASCFVVAVALMSVCLGWWHTVSTRAEHAVSASRTTADYKVDWLRNSTQELQTATRILTHKMMSSNVRAITGMQRLRTKFVSVDTDLRLLQRASQLPARPVFGTEGLTPWVAEATALLAAVGTDRLSALTSCAAKTMATTEATYSRAQQSVLVTSSAIDQADADFESSCPVQVASIFPATLRLRNVFANSDLPMDETMTTLFTPILTPGGTRQLLVVFLSPLYAGMMFAMAGLSLMVAGLCLCPERRRLSCSGLVFSKAGCSLLWLSAVIVCVLAHALLLAHIFATDLCAASQNPHWVAIVANQTGARSILASTPGCEGWSLEQLMAIPPIAGPTPPSTLPQSAAAFCRDVSVSEAFPVFSNGHALTHWVSSGHNLSLADVVTVMDECQSGLSFSEALALLRSRTSSDPQRIRSSITALVEQNCANATCAPLCTDIGLGQGEATPGVRHAECVMCVGSQCELYDAALAVVARIAREQKALSSASALLRSLLADMAEVQRASVALLSFPRELKALGRDANERARAHCEGFRGQADRALASTCDGALLGALAAMGWLLYALAWALVLLMCALILSIIWFLAPDDDWQLTGRATVYGKETYHRSLELTRMYRVHDRRGDALKVDIHNRGAYFLSETKHHPVEDLAFPPDTDTEATASASKSAEAEYEVDARWRRRLTAMYARYDPDKLNPKFENVVDVALRNNVGREASLLRTLVDRYGPEPEEAEPGPTFLDPSDHLDLSTNQEEVSPPHSPPARTFSTKKLKVDRALGSGTQVEYRCIVDQGSDSFSVYLFKTVDNTKYLYTKGAGGSLSLVDVVTSTRHPELVNRQTERLSAFRKYTNREMMSEDHSIADLSALFPHHFQHATDILAHAYQNALGLLCSKFLAWGDAPDGFTMADVAKRYVRHRGPLCDKLMRPEEVQAREMWNKRMVASLETAVYPSQHRWDYAMLSDGLRAQLEGQAFYKMNRQSSSSLLGLAATSAYTRAFALTEGQVVSTFDSNLRTSPTEEEQVSGKSWQIFRDQFTAVLQPLTRANRGRGHDGRRGRRGGVHAQVTLVCMKDIGWPLLKMTDPLISQWPGQDQFRESLVQGDRISTYDFLVAARQFCDIHDGYDSHLLRGLVEAASRYPELSHVMLERKGAHGEALPFDTSWVKYLAVF